MAVYVGIDPGKKGAMAIMGYSNTTGERYMMKIIPFDPQEYIKTLKQFHIATCCIEQVHALHGNGITSSFSFGQTYGWLLGILDALGISYQTISPQRWKREYGLNSEKEKSIEVCKRLFPDVDLKRTERCKKDDDGYAESLLLAEYARRHM